MQPAVQTGQRWQVESQEAAIQGHSLQPKWRSTVHGRYQSTAKQGERLHCQHGTATHRLLCGATLGPRPPVQSWVGCARHSRSTARRVPAGPHRGTGSQGCYAPQRSQAPRAQPSRTGRWRALPGLPPKPPLPSCTVHLRVAAIRAGHGMCTLPLRDDSVCAAVQTVARPRAVASSGGCLWHGSHCVHLRCD